MGVHHAGSLMLWMRASRELLNGYGRAFFDERKAEVANITYTILQKFANCKRPLGVEPRANDSLHTPRMFLKERLKQLQLQQFVPKTFQKERAPSGAAEKMLWNRIKRDGGQCVEKKDILEGRAR